MNVGIDFVKPGMVIMEDIYTDSMNGYPLVRNGIELNENIIYKLKENGIKNIKIRSNYSLNETIDDELRGIVISSLKNFDYKNIKSIINSSSEVAKKIEKSDSFNFDLARYFISNNDSYEHSLNVAQFACALCKIYNKKYPSNEIKIEDVALASILHEIGKQELDSYTLNKIKLDDNYLDKNNFPGYKSEMFESYKKENYPVYGFALIKDNPQIPSSVKVAILLQKENFSKSDFGPLNASASFLRNSKVYNISKIIHICDIYEYLIRNSLILGESVSNVIEIMKINSRNGIIDEELLKLLFLGIPLYGKETRVILNGSIDLGQNRKINFDGKKATVVEQDLNFPDRPKIMIDGVKSVIPLSKFQTITIKKIMPLDYENLFMKNNSENSVNRGRSL